MGRLWGWWMERAGASLSAEGDPAVQPSVFQCSIADSVLLRAQLVRSSGVSTPNIVAGLALWYGGRFYFCLYCSLFLKSPPTNGSAGALGMRRY